MRSRALEPCFDIGQKSWGGRALALWCGMAPWFGRCMVPGEEAGRDVSPAAAEAGKWDSGLLPLMGTHASKEAGSRERWFKQGLIREEATFNAILHLFKSKRCSCFFPLSTTKNTLMTSEPLKRRNVKVIILLHLNIASPSALLLPGTS